MKPAVAVAFLLRKSNRFIFYMQHLSPLFPGFNLFSATFSATKREENDAVWQPMPSLTERQRRGSIRIPPLSVSDAGGSPRLHISERHLVGAVWLLGRRWGEYRAECQKSQIFDTPPMVFTANTGAYASGSLAADFFAGAFLAVDLAAVVLAAAAFGFAAAFLAFGAAAAGFSTDALPSRMACSSL